MDRDLRPALRALLESVDDFAARWMVTKAINDAREVARAALKPVQNDATGVSGTRPFARPDACPACGCASHEGDCYGGTLPNPESCHNEFKPFIVRGGDVEAEADMARILRGAAR